MMQAAWRTMKGSINASNNIDARLLANAIDAIVLLVISRRGNLPWRRPHKHAVPRHAVLLHVQPSTADAEAAVAVHSDFVHYAHWALRKRGVRPKKGFA